MDNHSKVIKCNSYRWEGVARKTYKEDTSCYKGVHRYSLLGEGKDEHELNFQSRYFEVSPGGYTSLEYHRHPHSVVIIRGSGLAIVGNEMYDISLHDVVFIAPETLHQFQADKGEPLGFLCMVDRYRDKPVIPGEAYLETAIPSEEVRRKIRR